MELLSIEKLHADRRDLIQFVIPGTGNNLFIFFPEIVHFTG